MEKRQKFTPEVKREAIRLLQKTDKPKEERTSGVLQPDPSFDQPSNPLLKTGSRSNAPIVQGVPRS